MEKGTRVRFGQQVRRLGLVATLDTMRFEPETVTAGDEGVYVGPHPSPRMPDWHVVQVEVGGRKLFCPTFEGTFEPVGV